MKARRLLTLAIQEMGSSPGRHWPLAAGIALGLACLVFLLGLARGVEDLLHTRVLGSLPDRIRVEPPLLRLGPVRLGEGLGEEQVDRLRRLPGVKAVYRQARLPRPCQLQASYGGQSLWSDVVVEGVDPGLVEGQISRGFRFQPPAPGQAVPAVLPQVVVDVLNAGIAIHTNLPRLDADLLPGLSFTLLVGTSSFSPGPSTAYRCTIVGLSDQVGAGGPAVPLEVLRDWTREPLSYHAVTLQLDSPERVAQVAAEVRALGMSTPGLDVARRISAATGAVRRAMGAFGAAILLVAALSIFTGLNLQVREEEGLIGLYRALGASRRDVLFLYMSRAFLVGAVGGLVGLALGLAAGTAVEAAARRLLAESLAGAHLFRPGWLLPGGCLAFGLAISLAGGLAPARRAAGLRPADALRRE